MGRQKIWNSLTHTHSHTHRHTQTHTHTRTHALSLPLTHTHSHPPHMRAHTHTNTHTHTLTHTQDRARRCQQTSIPLNKLNINKLLLLLLSPRPDDREKFTPQPQSARQRESIKGTVSRRGAGGGDPGLPPGVGSSVSPLPSSLVRGRAHRASRHPSGEGWERRG